MGSINHTPYTQPHFVSLLSTGLDSPIATYLIMKKGYNCHSLSFLNGKNEKEKNKSKVLAIGKHLVEITHQKLTMFFVDYDYYLDRIKSSIDEKKTCIICKRIMISTAVELIHKYGGSFIVNGDILGEQASQTLDNLYCVHQVNKHIPIIRPLIGFDKLDVIKLSQKLGFYELSLIEGVSCVSNPKYPETRGNVEEIIHNESKFPRDEIIQEIMANLEVIEFS